MTISFTKRTIEGKQIKLWFDLVTEQYNKKILC
jgi:hypothetical protein